MAFMKMIRRRLCKPLFLIFIIFLVWYTMLLVMGTNIKLPNEDNSDKALINAQRALEDSVIVQTDKREKPLQPPDNNEIESQPKDNKLPPPIEDNIPYEEEKNDENLEIKIDVDNENEESEEESTIDDKKQINPPLKELPNVDVIIKEGLGN